MDACGVSLIAQAAHVMTILNLQLLFQQVVAQTQVTVGDGRRKLHRVTLNIMGGNSVHIMSLPSSFVP
jgi:hypothetical protein